MTKVYLDTAEIESHFGKAFTARIVQYVEKYKDNMIARQILANRPVPASAEIDVVTYYNRANEGAIIAAKGVVPPGSGLRSSHLNFSIYQVLDGFDIHEKDMKVDPTLKTRDLDIILRNVHRKEDSFALNGDSTLNALGLTGTIPTANKITTGTNHGSWDGTDTTIDIHADLISAIRLMDGKYDPAWLLGNRSDILYLYSLDSERQPYWKTIAPLFGKSDSADPSTWLKMSNHITAGHVYAGPTHPEAAEFVISENPYHRILPLQRGGTYPVEICEWVTVEFHDANAFVEIATG